MKRVISVLLLVSILLLIATPVFANQNTGRTGVEDLFDRLDRGSIADQISPNAGGGQDEAEILRQIDERISNIVATVRVLATIFAVVFFIWMGFIFFTAGGNPHKLVEAKTQIVMFFISMLCIFAAEPIVRFVLSWFLTDMIAGQ
jgi:hypothetical protein